MINKFFLFLFLLCSLNVYSQTYPTNNPYTEKYGIDSTHWTNTLPWHRVFLITDYQGDTWDEKLTKAQADVVSAGGGVIYFPGGTYQFQDDITIRKHVIIRGETPENTDAVKENFAPPTRWVFPQYIPSFEGEGTEKSSAFKRIRTEYTNYGSQAQKPNDRNHSTGLVYLDINRANIIFHPSVYNPQVPGGAVDYHPCYMDKVILFGIRNNNAALAFPWIPTQGGWQKGWQRWPWTYMANIDAWVDENLVLSNNRLNDYENNTEHPITDDSFDQPGYVVAIGDTIGDDEGHKARFDYNDHYGIVVNRFLNYYEYLGNDFSGDLKVLGSGLATTPKEDPDIFGQNIEINDNYLYQTKRCAMFVGGMNMTIKNNVIRDNSGKKAWIASSGQGRVSYEAYFENRGIDYSGWNILIENNNVEVYSTHFEESTYSSNDGEGIMIQECCGGSLVINHKIIGNTLNGNNAYIGLYKTRSITDVLIADNNMNGKGIYVNANTNSTEYYLDSVIIENNTNVGYILATGGYGKRETVVRNNQGTGGDLTYSCFVKLENNQNLTKKDPCSGDSTLKKAIVVYFTNYDTDTVFVADTVTTIQLEGYYNHVGNMSSVYLWEGLNQIDTAKWDSIVFDAPLHSGTNIFQIVIGYGSDVYAKSKPLVVQKVYTPEELFLSIDEKIQEKWQVKIYPNPLKNNQFTVEWGRDQLAAPVSIQVYDLTGNKLQNLKSAAGQYRNTVSLAGYASGVYLVKIQAGNKKAIYKIVK